MPLVYKYAMCPYTPDFCAACAVAAEAKVTAYCDEWDVRVTEMLNGGQNTRLCNGGCPNIEGVARVLDRAFAICKAQGQGQGTVAGLEIFFLLAALPKVQENVKSVYCGKVRNCDYVCIRLLLFALQYAPG